MPDDLAGLCKLRVGDWRILYWLYHTEKTCGFTGFNTDPKCIATFEADSQLGGDAALCGGSSGEWRLGSHIHEPETDALGVGPK